MKVPRGSAVPPGYTFIRRLRTADVYVKNEAAPVQKAQIDELESMFARMGMGVVVIEPTDDLEKALSRMMMGEGGKRTTRKRTPRKGKRSSKRKTPRHRTY